MKHRTKLGSAIISGMIIFGMITPSFAMPVITESKSDSTSAHGEFKLDDSQLINNLNFKEAPVNPEFTKQQNEIVQSSNGEGRNFGLKVDPFKYHTTKSLVHRGVVGDSPLPAKYDLRDENRVTSVKNQGPNGSCWAFASYGSAESSLLPNLKKDFSEKHLRNTHGYDYGPNQGGTANMATAYLARWSGAIKESDDPYSPYDFNSPRNVVRDMEIDETKFVPDVYDNATRNELKRAIRKFGVAYTTVCGNRQFTNFSTMGHYDGGRGSANHAVCIVGWDDNFSKYNFKTTPRGNGAWIVKNSWGQDWGKYNGYYYVSYYDGEISRNNTFIKLRPKSPSYKKNWYYDPYGMTSSTGQGSTGYFANVFGPVKRNSKITEVGFYAPSNGASYEVYVNANIGGDRGFNDKVKVAEGSFKYAGYYTVDIDPVIIREGDYFAPIVKIKTPGFNNPIPIETRYRGYTSNASSKKGQSYISYDGSNWSDLTNYKRNANVCLKAFTEPAEVEEVKVKSIKLTLNEEKMQVGESQRVNVEVKPNSASNKALKWESSNEEVVSVKNGLVKALKVGTAKITATAKDGSDVSASVDVTVVKADNVQNKLKIFAEVESQEVVKGDNAVVNVQVHDKNGLIVENADVNCKITDSKGQAVEVTKQTDRYGKVKFTIGTKKGLGKYKLDFTATYKNYLKATVSKSFVVIAEDNNKPAMKMDVKFDKSVYKKGSQVNMTLQAKTADERYRLKYVDYDVVITRPDGEVKKISNKTSYYGRANVTYNIANNAPYGTYKVKITSRRSDYRTFTTTKTFEVKKIKSRYDVDVKLAADKVNYRLGDSSVINIKTAYYNGQAASNFPLYINVKSDKGFNYDLQKRTDSYGRSKVTLTPTQEMGNGVYTVTVKAYYNYRGRVYKGQESFVVNYKDEDDEDDSFYKRVETEEGQQLIEKNANNPEFVLLDVRTKAEFRESHIKGAIQHDYYSPDIKEYLLSLDKDKTYLIYCRTQNRSKKSFDIMKANGFKHLYYMYGGMTKWLKEGRPAVMPEYEKTLDTNVAVDKTSYAKNETVKLNFDVKDVEGNAIRKGKVSYKIYGPDNSVLKTDKIVMGNHGTKEATFELKDAKEGLYKIIGEATRTNFKAGKSVALFRVGESKKFMSYEEREKAGQFKHLKSTDLEAKVLKKHYGKNILQYMVKDGKLNDKQILSLVNTDKNSILVFGYPGCGPCVTMMKDMSKLPHKKYNYLEIITSVEQNVQETIDFTEKVLKEQDMMNLKEHIYYDSEDVIWGNRLGFLTTPNTVVLDQNGRFVNCAGVLDKDGLYKLYDKTFKEEDGEDDDSFYKRVETEEGQQLIEKNANNPEFVLLDVRTKAEFRESHIKGAIQHDYYSPDIKEYLLSLDKDKTYLIYCRTQNRSKKSFDIMKANGFKHLYYMYGGMTKWLKEGRPAVMPEYEKTLDTNVAVDKTSYAKNETVKLNFDVKDVEGNAIRKGKVSYKIYGPDNSVLKTDKIVMGNHGTKEATFELKDAKEGLYKIIGEATRTNFKAGKSVALFRVGERKKFLSYEERKKAGQFKHLKSTDLEAKVLKKHYGKNILQYMVKDGKLNDKQILSLVNTDKNSILVFGYPGCGPCVTMMKDMSKLPHKKYNYLEIITSVEQNVQETIDFTEKVLKEQDMMNLKEHIYYDSEDVIWGNRLGFLTTPNTVVLDQNGRFVNCAGVLDKDGLYKLYDKTFNENNQPDPEPEDKTVEMTLKSAKDTVKQGEEIKAVVKLQKGEAIVDDVKVAFELKAKGNVVDSKKVNAKQKVYNYAYKLADDSVAGEYTLTAKLIGDKYECDAKSVTIFVEKKEQPEPDTDKYMSLDARYNNGEINGSAYRRLKSIYGKNINDYKVKKLTTGSTVKLSEITDGKRPTVIAIGYPG